MNFLQFAADLYSCRKFTDRQVEGSLIDQILEAAQKAPTATNAQAFHIWIVRDPDSIAKVNRATKNGYGAGTMLILGADPKNAWTREYDAHNFADIDAGIIGTHILFEVQSLGLGTTWVGRIDPNKLAEIFPETQGYTIAGLFPIGYPSPDKGGQPSKMHSSRKALTETTSTL